MRGLCGAAALLCIALTARADPPTTVMHIMREGELKFSPSKVVPGASNSVLWGSPAAAGQTYIVRNRFSPNTFSPPHFHPETRYVTLIKGTWWVGSGPKFDKDASREPDPLGRREGRGSDRADHGPRAERHHCGRRSRPAETMREMA
jgi:hypothetical protein